MNLYRKFVQNRRQQGITGKPESAGKEIAEHDDFVSFRSGNLLIEGSATVSSRKESSCLVFPD
jgi:hypothetical protein